MLLTLMQRFDRTRWQSVFFYHPHPPIQLLADELRRDGFEAVALPLPEGELGVADIQRLARALRSYQPDIFHAHLAWGGRCTHALFAAFVARVPRVATQQLFVRSTRRRIRYRQLAWSAMVDRYVAVSTAMAARLGRSILRAGHVRVVHNGIEVEPFDRPPDPALRASLTGGAERPLVLTLARLHWQKGLRYLVAAAAEVPEAVFIVAGDGEERPRLEDDVQRLGVGHRFRFIGRREDIPDLLAACDLVVLPSLFEGLPVSILEAMAARKPIVATAIEGNDEVVADGITGLLVPPADPASLAGAIRRVLGDPHLAHRLGSASHARVEQQFSARAMVSGVEQVYQELLSR